MGRWHETGATTLPGKMSGYEVYVASVYDLTSVTVQMSLSFPQGNFEKGVNRCLTPGNPPCPGNFSVCKQYTKGASGQEWFRACPLLKVRINFTIKNPKRHQKQPEVTEIRLPEHNNESKL